MRHLGHLAAARHAAAAVLTSVDVEPEHQRLARAGYLAAGFSAGRLPADRRARAQGAPRLADGAYDMVFCDADRQEFAEYLASRAAAAAARRDRAVCNA